jgi:hypothetical protein
MGPFLLASVMWLVVHILAETTGSGMQDCADLGIEIERREEEERKETEGKENKSTKMKAKDEAKK